MARLEELVRKYDSLPADSREAKGLLMQIGAWDGPLEELSGALHITMNGSPAAEILKGAIDAMDAPHRHAISSNKRM